MAIGSTIRPSMSLFVPGQGLRDEEDDDRRRHRTDARQGREQAPVAERADQESGRRRPERRAEDQARADDHLRLARPPRVGQAVGHPGGGEDREEAVAQTVQRLVRHGQPRGFGPRQPGPAGRP